MGSFGTIKLKKVWKMLGECAPGYDKTKTKHHWHITYNGQQYRGMPLGKHGARRNPEVELGHVKHMARLFEILECAKGVLPQL